MPAGRSRPAGMGSWSGSPTRRTVPANTASRGRGSRSASRSSTGRAGGWRSRRRGRARRSRFCRAARWGGSTGWTRAPYMCTRPPLVAPHTSPSRRLRRFCFPVRPIRANVDGRRPPAAATTRRNRVHDPARNRLDRHPRCPPRGTATAYLQPPGADPGGPRRRLPPGLPGPAVPVPQHRSRPDRPSRCLLRSRRADRHVDHLPDPPVPTDPARRRGGHRHHQPGDLGPPPHVHPRCPLGLA